MQVYRKAGFFFFNACMRIKVKPRVSAMQRALPYSCSRWAYPQPRDALIETCCQSDKHICIQSTLYLFSLERSTVCCWLNILNQFAVSELPAKLTCAGRFFIRWQISCWGMGQGNRRPFLLTLSGFAPMLGCPSVLPQAPGLMGRWPEQAAFQEHLLLAGMSFRNFTFFSKNNSLLSSISKILPHSLIIYMIFFTWYFPLNRLRPDICTNSNLILSHDDKT